MGRPTSFFYEIPRAGHPGLRCCSNCTSAILSVGNPLIWWGAAIALVRPAVLVGRPPGLARRRGPGRSGRRLPSVVPVPGADHVLLLRRVLRTVPGAGAGLLPGPGPWPRGDPLWRRRSGLYLVALFVVAAVLVSAFFYPVWTAEVIPLPGLAHPDVDAVLDLGQDCRGKSAGLRADQRNGDSAVREASTGLLVELDPDSNVTDLLLRAAREGSRATPSTPAKAPTAGPTSPAHQFLQRCHCPRQRPDRRRPRPRRHRGGHVRHPL